ncbi:type II toxin-antitoxin system RelE/ParE family toxin [bacterium]|nr:type II toxin-antitoxin system RelE/ParE family toxin [bacterium]
MSEYRITFYRKSSTGEKPALEYIHKLDVKTQAKVAKYIEFLKESDGRLDEPYSRHIKGKIRELRVDFAHNRHRIFYFAFINKNIILLSAFLKKTEKTPRTEVERALAYYQDVLNNIHYYE